METLNNQDHLNKVYPTVKCYLSKEFVPEIPNMKLV